MELRDEHSAMAVVLIREKSQTRVLTIKNRNGWAFPKGHVEEGESEEEAAKRECLEESGVDLSKAICHGKVHEFTIVFGAAEMRMSQEEFHKMFKTDVIRKLISAYCFELPYSQPFVLESSFIAGDWTNTMDAFRVLAYEENKVALSKALNLVSN